ncbi:hypothetical protein KAI32_02380 [Candidatus Pacearchaeota archaeon]|nr:hypothetical protein [Candidatus Pacearchaeota archaeon]
MSMGVISKKGQVTIFIVVAIVIVVAIIGAIFFMGGNKIYAPTDVDPNQIVEKCVKDAVEKSVWKMLANGGQRSPSQAIMYKGSEYNYLCYQADYYQGCYNIHPMLESLVEEEIEEDTKVAVQDCFNSMREDFEGRGFDVSGGSANYSIDLLPGSVEINLKKKIDLVRGESSQNFENFDTKILSPLYELIKIARDIVNSESEYCHFEYNGYMLLYPNYDIKRIDYSDSKIYILVDRKSGMEFKFAVRSCAFAPGI